MLAPVRVLVHTIGTCTPRVKAGIIVQAVPPDCYVGGLGDILLRPSFTYLPIPTYVPITIRRRFTMSTSIRSGTNLAAAAAT